MLRVVNLSNKHAIRKKENEDRERGTREGFSVRPITPGPLARIIPESGCNAVRASNERPADSAPVEGVVRLPFVERYQDGKKPRSLATLEQWRQNDPMSQVWPSS